MAIEQTFRRVVVLPPVKDLHQTLIAFLATSEQGTWQVDGQVQNTPYAMHFLRGNWRRAWFGLSDALTPGLCDVDSSGHNVPETRPMKLAITARPSPQDIRLVMLFSVFSIVTYDQQRNQRYVDYWEDRITKEIKELSEYLRKCYGLPEPLRCEYE
jgi:hypothetical protein